MSCFATIVSVPPNAENFKSVSQSETSITLRWNNISDNVSFILVIDGTQKTAVEAVGEGTVTLTVSNLTAATTHTFLLYSVLRGVLSSGVNLSAVTGKTSEMTVFSNGHYFVCFFGMCVRTSI